MMICSVPGENRMLTPETPLGTGFLMAIRVRRVDLCRSGNESLPAPFCKSGFRRKRDVVKLAQALPDVRGGLGGV